MERLRQKYGQGGLLHFGQGKWYPGEQLPRWSLNLYWRKDGEPIWSDPSLLRRRARRRRRDRGDRRASSSSGWPMRLGVDRGNVFPAYEDAWYYLWRERKLPSNVDPFDSRLADALERARLRRVFERGLDAPVGHVLPVARDEREPGRWRSSALVPARRALLPDPRRLADRLPPAARFAALGAPSDMPWLHAPDPTGLPPLPRDADPPTTHGDAAETATRRGDGRAGVRRRARRARDAGRHARRRVATTVRRARDATSQVPPMRRRRARRRAELRRSNRPASSSAPPSAPSRATAGSTSSCRRRRRSRTTSTSSPRSRTRRAAMRMPVILEGYEPPRDPRLQLLRVTPDPGVIEVNVQPAPSWDELVEQTTHLYDAARADAADDREVHARRPPHRHRRRQPLRARRRDAGRLAVPAPARPAAPA